MGGYEVEVAVRKTPKRGVTTSGDSLDVVERPGGGLSIVMADGQGSGPAAKRISNLVVARAVSLIADGVRDGAVARAVHDSLFSFRGGKVVCTLTILSVDLRTNTFVISRNGNAGAWLFDQGDEMRLIDEVPAIGVHQFTKPQIHEAPLEPGNWACIYTDGVRAVSRSEGGVLDLGIDPATFTDLIKGGARGMADQLFDTALSLASGRPRDDLSLALALISDQPRALGEVAIRAIDIRFPF